MRVVDTITSAPIPVQKSVRGREVRALSSFRAGTINPHWATVLLREDRVSRGRLSMTFDMAETIHPLLNAVGVTVMAHFIPFSAFERFPGMDGFNKSYLGLKDREADAAPIPFFETVNFAKAAPFWNKLGVHWPEGSPVNSAYLEAYNVLVNWLREMRSKDLPARTLTDTSLAEAFWQHPFQYHIKPDFDQALMDGEVELQLGSGQLPIRGLARYSDTASHAGRAEIGTLETLDPPNTDTWHQVASSNAIEVFAELENQGVKLLLSDIELAKKTAAFARMRERYKGRSDDDLIDLLMSGIRVPDEDLKQPILLDKKTTIFGYSERHAMDGASLDQSVTVGKTVVTLNLRTPPMNTGGIILVTSQIVPEQLFERMMDPFLGITAPSQLPEFIRDFLDPEKVDVVPNKFVDVLHGTPDGTFGYAPLNHVWKGSDTRIGGKFYRPVPDAFVEDRQRFWSVETPNPALNSTFYLVPDDLPHSVFADTEADPFEVTTLGALQIVGNTVFGAVFEEGEDHYAAVAEKVDTTRIVLPDPEA